MHGLVNRALQCFLRDNYGPEIWTEIAAQADLGFDNFESMLLYDDRCTYEIVRIAAEKLEKPVEVFLEDLGTYLVSHPNTESLRRLLRFSGETFIDFLHSLDDLKDRARLAVPELILPELLLTENADGSFILSSEYRISGFGYVIMGVMRAMADDYGALVFLEYDGAMKGVEQISINVVESAFFEGRSFELSAQVGT